MKSPKYYIDVRYHGYDQKFDQYLEKLLKRSISASGYGVGLRDLSFDYFRLDAATRACTRLRKIKKNKLRVSLYKLDIREPWNSVKLK